MEVELIRVDDAFHFEAKGGSGNIVHIDAAEKIGGTNSGSRPMELLLMGLGEVDVTKRSQGWARRRDSAREAPALLNDPLARSSRVWNKCRAAPCVLDLDRF